MTPALTPDEIVTLTEILVILLGIGITWWVYKGSDKAELPGDAQIPVPEGVDDAISDSSGRTL
jgi:cbb3-type cytochrome oxidase subunit 3